MPSQDWRRLADDLAQTIGLEAPPIAITFASEIPTSAPTFGVESPQLLASQGSIRAETVGAERRNCQPAWPPCATMPWRNELSLVQVPC